MTVKSGTESLRTLYALGFRTYFNEGVLSVAARDMMSRCREEEC